MSPENARAAKPVLRGSIPKRLFGRTGPGLSGSGFAGGGSPGCGVPGGSPGFGTSREGRSGGGTSGPGFGSGLSGGSVVATLCRTLWYFISPFLLLFGYLQVSGKWNRPSRRALGTGRLRRSRRTGKGRWLGVGQRPRGRIGIRDWVRVWFGTWDWHDVTTFQRIGFSLDKHEYPGGLRAVDYFSHATPVVANAGPVTCHDGILRIHRRHVWRSCESCGSSSQYRDNLPEAIPVTPDSARVVLMYDGFHT